jgi:hypothetical protein
LRDMPRYQWQLVSLMGRQVSDLALEIVRGQFSALCG